MKKAISIGIFSAVVVLIVAMIVFSSGNNQAPLQNSGTNNPSSNSQNQEEEQNDSQDTTQPADKISREELTSHNAQSDCWVSYNGDVFDITNWLPKHPGSAMAIVPYCGTAEEFEQAFSGQHGTSKVGKLTEEGVFKGELE